MKKILALAVVMLLLLTGCTFAGQEGAGFGVSLADIAYATAEGAMDLTGCTLNVQAAQTEDTKGMRLGLDIYGEPYAEAVVALTEEYAALCLTGNEGVVAKYVVNDPDMMAQLNEALEEALANPQVTVNGSENGALSAALGQMLTTGEAELDDETAAELAETVAAVQEILEGSITEGEPLEIDGVTFNTVELEITHDQLMELIAAQGTEETQQTIDQLTEAGVTVDVYGTMYTAEAEDMFYMDIYSVVSGAEEVQLVVEVELDRLDPEAGNGLWVTVYEGEDVMAQVYVNVNGSLLDDTDWLNFDVSDATVLSEEDFDNLDETLGTEFETWTTQVVNGVMAVMMNNQAGLSQ